MIEIHHNMMYEKIQGWVENGNCLQVDPRRCPKDIKKDTQGNGKRIGV